MLFALMLLSALALTLLLGQPIARAATATIPATEGQQFSQTIAGAHYDCSGQPTSEQASIAWGDATTSSGTVTVSGSELQIAGAHTYAEEGAFSGSISGSYTCAVGAGPIPFTAGFDAQVADAALTATAQTVSAVAGQAFTVTIATFADADPGAAAGDYTVAVDWGDGTPPTAGTVTAAPAGGFAVGASHTYATAGSYAVTVTVSDAGGASARATTTATATAPHTSGGLTLNLAPGARFDGTVATATSQCLASQLTSGVTATINWGDDHSSPARALISGGALQFAGSHVYAVAGNYIGSVTGSYHCGQQVLQIGSLGFGGVVALVNVVELRAQGMDVTQGIVNDGNLNPSGVLRGGSANFSGLTWSPPDTSGDKLPGPTLASQNWTVVRLYADAHGATGAGLLGVGAQLYGYRNGQPLAGSPLTPDYGPASLPDTGEADPAPVYTAERTSDANAFTFTLPQSWTDAGTITLVGRLTPPPPSTNGLFKTVTCATAGCNADESYSLANVSFVLLPYVVIAPVAMVQPSEPALPDPYSLYWNALRTEPNATGYIVLPYVATVNPTQVIDDPTAYDPKGDLNSGYLQLLEWFAGWYYYGVPGTHLPNIITAVNEDQRGVTVNSIYNYPSPAFDVVNIFRPLTSVAHELGHALGRNHADDSAASGKADGTGSTGCGGGGGPWPPDGLGYMQGIGLDRSTSPYRILYPGLPGEPSQWYDKMSYCVNTDESSQGGNVPDTWTSPFGWLHSISALYVFGKATGRIVHAVRGRAAPDRTPPDRVHGAASSGRGLFVTAVSDSAGTKIVGVVPSTGGAPTPPQTGGFTLVARNGAGQTVATGSLYAQQVHDDPGPTYTDMFGTVAAAGAASVAIVHDGTVIATRVRPPHPPRVRVLAPTAGSRVGGRRPVSVRWRATDPGGRIQMVAVDCSADGGRHWRTVYVGPNSGHATLPSFYFARSRDARVRVRASDGFNVGAARSARFVALGSPPQVSILDPSGTTRIAAGARLQLLGRAFDQQLRALAAGRLEWLDGPFRLGRGTALSAEPLPPGRNVIRLLARSVAGAAESKPVVVLVGRPALPFLRLRVPRRLGPGARSLTLVASSTVAATLAVARRRLALARRPRRLVLRIGRGPLLLELAVTRAGVRTPFAVRVER